MWSGGCATPVGPSGSGAGQRAFIKRVRDSELGTAQGSQIRERTSSHEVDFEIISRKIRRSFSGEESDRLPVKVGSVLRQPGADPMYMTLL